MNLWVVLRNPFFFVVLFIFVFPNSAISSRICIQSLLAQDDQTIDSRPLTSYSQVSGSEFFAAFEMHKNPRFHKSRSHEEFVKLSAQGSRFFLNPQQNAGYGITAGGELISIFNASNRSGLGADAVQHAIQNGAYFLHCLEPLKTYFSRFGFIVDTTDVSQSLDVTRQNMWTNQGGQVPLRLRMVLKSNSH